jgi:uncharacterized caspase-like protein
VNPKGSRQLNIQIPISLSTGENRIEASVTNATGAESFKMPIVINYSPVNEVEEKVYFIGIGMDRFADNRYNLQYSSKDIRDLAVKLQEKFPGISVDTFFNQGFTMAGLESVRSKLMATGINDKVIVSYSGHGLLSSDFDYYLSTYDINFDQPEKKGVAYEELERLLDSIPARKKLLLIDACHSGEVDKDELVRLNRVDTGRLKKGLKPVAYRERSGPLGLKNSFELMQTLFVNVGKGTGATIISAAAGTQFALERNDLRNGVFTYALLEAMRDHPALKIKSLKYLLGKRVDELTDGLQKPTSRSEPFTLDWLIWGNAD